MNTVKFISWSIKIFKYRENIKETLYIVSQDSFQYIQFNVLFYVFLAGKAGVCEELLGVRVSVKNVLLY